MRRLSNVFLGMLLSVGIAGCAGTLPDFDIKAVHRLDDVEAKFTAIAHAPPDDRSVTPEARAAADDIVQKVADARLKCIAYELQVETYESKRKDGVVRAKLITGALTGGITGVTGVVAGAGALSDSKITSSIFGFITSGIGVVGSITAIAISPGQELSQTTQNNIIKINTEQDYIMAIMNKPEWWKNENDVNQLRTIHIPNLIGRCSQPL